MKCFHEAFVRAINFEHFFSFDLTIIRFYKFRDIINTALGFGIYLSIRRL
jgi:hypothetical protein